MKSPLQIRLLNLIDVLYFEFIRKKETPRRFTSTFKIKHINEIVVFKKKEIESERAR